MRHYLALVPMLLLAACVQPETTVVGGLPAANACEADKYQGLIGQPASVLDNMSFAAGTRILKPNMPVTMDFSPNRLNIEVSRNGRIDKVSCY